MLERVRCVGHRHLYHARGEPATYIRRVIVAPQRRQGPRYAPHSQATDEYSEEDLRERTGYRAAGDAPAEDL